MPRNMRLVVGVFVSLVTASQSYQHGKPATDEVPFGQAAKQIDDEATPTVDYDSRDGVDRIDKTVRKAKNARYNRGPLPSNPHPEIGDIRTEPERRAGFSDLPAGKSDVIAEAIVGNSRAFLSDDKTGVYSEFSIVIAKVWQGRSSLTVAPGDTLIVERFGGRVRYPSGKVIRARVVGEGVPILGKRYLFFLAKADQDSYKLLTAYEIQDNKVFALDGSRTEPRGQGSSIFDKHNGKTFDGFIREVEAAINSSHVGDLRHEETYPHEGRNFFCLSTLVWWIKLPRCHSSTASLSAVFLWTRCPGQL
jgi:hypothetical protein